MHGRQVQVGTWDWMGPRMPSRSAEGCVAAMELLGRSDPALASSLVLEPTVASTGGVGPWHSNPCDPVPLHPSVRETCFAVHNALGSKCQAEDEQHAPHAARSRRAGTHLQVSLAVCNGQLALAVRSTASPHNDHQREAYAESEQRHNADCDEEPVPPLEPAAARWQWHP